MWAQNDPTRWNPYFFGGSLSEGLKGKNWKEMRFLWQRLNPLTDVLPFKVRYLSDSIDEWYSCWISEVIILILFLFQAIYTPTQGFTLTHALMDQCKITLRYLLSNTFLRVCLCQLSLYWKQLPHSRIICSPLVFLSSLEDISPETNESHRGRGGCPIQI